MGSFWLKVSERLKVLRELLITSLVGVLGHIASGDWTESSYAPVALLSILFNVF